MASALATGQSGVSDLVKRKNDTAERGMTVLVASTGRSCDLVQPIIASAIRQDDSTADA